MGRPKYAGNNTDLNRKDTFVGFEAQSRREFLSLKYPIERGIVANWDDMEKIWHHTFHNELRVAPEEQQLVVTEAPLNPVENIKHNAQILFEKFNIQSFYAENGAIASLFATSRTTGLIISSGYGVTHTVPVIEGYVPKIAAHGENFGGADVDRYIAELTATTLKEHLSFVSQDFQRDVNRLCPQTESIKQQYHLPDSTEVLDRAKFIGPELLFDPSLAQLMGDGIHTSAFQSIMRCEKEKRSELFKNIVLVGGNTMFPGIAERLQRELTNLAPRSVVKVEASPNRINLAWIGCAISAGLSFYDDQKVTNSEYEECGASIVNRKFDRTNRV